MILLLLVFLIQDLKFDFSLDGFAESMLGFNLGIEEKEKIKKNIEKYPGCDFFYVPALKEKDEDAFKKFFLSSGTEPIILLYLLKSFETYEEILVKNKIDKIELLKRFLWSLKIKEKGNKCPFKINFKKPEILGYFDEISKECYGFSLIYSLNEFKDSINFSSCAPIQKENINKTLENLMRKYKIPFHYRKIEDETPKTILKKSGN